MTVEMTKPAMGSIFVLAAVLIFLVLLVALLVFSSSRATLEIGDNRLVVRSLFYGVDLPLNEIELEKVEAVNLLEQSPKISFRSNGIRLPGISVGWFRGDGKKYKLFVTDRSSVLSLPTTKGYTVLFSTPQAAAVADKLKGG